MNSADCVETVSVEGGAFRMGSERFYPEERPARPARVGPFRIDATPVTNARFARFVAETGYVTLAERPAADLPEGGSAVFFPTAGPVDLSDPSHWWRLVDGACWRRPLGPGSDLTGLGEHPVVHVSWGDAAAFAQWAGKRLPTEAEWEFAARGGLEGAEYAWGNALSPDGLVLANTWQGPFPHANSLADGWARTSPVRSFAGNGYGLFDMIGNVWEWTADDWSLPGRAAGTGRTCCSPDGARSAHRKVLKGGSYLCSPDYCKRYRPAARHPQPADSPTGHVGFRCVAA
jgi:formylglycine-generating enzyme required for sulfatase activity